MERSRTLDQRTSVPGKAYSWIYNRNPQQVYDNLGNWLHGETKTTVDVVTPDFKRRVSMGEVINNRFNSTTVVVQGEFTPYDHQIPNQIRYWCDAPGMALILGEPQCLNILSSGQIANAIATAQTSALAGVQASDFESLVNLGEAPETYRMLRRPINSLDRKLSSRSFAAKVDALGSLYLMGRYGIRPLVNEVSKGVSLLAHWQPPRPLRNTSRGYASAYQSASENTIEDLWGTFRLSKSVTKNTTLTVRAGVLYADMLAYDKLRRWGVMPHQFPEAFWELVPLSFIVDWFANVGDFLSAITPRVGVQELAHWTTTREVSSVSRVITSSYLWSSPWVCASKPAATQAVTRVTINRDPKPMSPTLGYREGSFTSVLNDPWRVADLGALVYQRILPKLSKFL